MLEGKELTSKKFPEFKVELLKAPSEEDWLWCKTCTLNTVGKKLKSHEITSDWKKRLIEAEHSPIRELEFGFRLTLPYWVSNHLIRHNVGVNHYVRSQRDDRNNDETPRADKPQGEIISHIISLNLNSLIYIAHKRLCLQASEETREIVSMMCRLAVSVVPEAKSVLVPNCVYRDGKCTEMFPCPIKDSKAKKERGD